MTLHKRVPMDHRILKARAPPAGGGSEKNPIATATGAGGDTNSSTDSADGASSSVPSSTQESTTQETQPTTTSTTQIPSSSSQQPSTTSSSTPTTTTQQQTFTSSSSVAQTTSASDTSTTSAAVVNTSTSASSTTRSTSSTTSTSTGATLVVNNTPTTTINTSRQTSSFASVGRTTLAPGQTVVASAIPSGTSSNLSTGAIVGSVAGGLAGLAIVGLIAAFILRRCRKRKNHRRAGSDFFGGSNFRRSAMVANTPTVSPPQMGQRGHSVALSIASGPGLAGQGAYGAAGSTAYGATTNAPSSNVGTTAAAAAIGAAAGVGAAVVLQERPRYTYGQDYTMTSSQPLNQEPAMDDSASEIAGGGAYSSEPQMQSAYNAESYGSYAAYEPPAAGGYQDATREYQGQHGYDDNAHGGAGQYTVDSYYETEHLPPHQPQEAFEYIVTSGVPATASPKAGRTKSISDDDAYGGM